MAEGGDLRQSINIGSDVLYELSCTPCAHNNINEEAEKYCVECREYFCVSCLKNHNSFAIMRNHHILDKAKMSAQGLQQTPMVLIEKCQVHHGNTIDTYCPVHQAVGCGTCIALKHTSCKGIAYIPKVAKGFKKSKEYKDIKPAIKSSIKQLKAFKTTIQTDLKDRQKEKDVALNDIKDYRRSIEITLDRMEKKITDEVHTKYKTIQADVIANMKSIEDTMSKLESSLKNLESIKEENEVDIFINVKYGNTKMTESDKLLQKLKEMYRIETIHFKQNLAIDECVKKNDKLGELQVHKLCSTSSTGEYNVKVKSDTETCNIGGCTFLDDGILLISDSSNLKIKRLNSAFQVTDYCDFPSNPFGLCVIDNKEVAVALPNEKKVQFVSVGKKLKLSRSFTTIGECIGLAYSNKQIIVSKNLNQNDVHIYSENGKCLRTITVDISSLYTNNDSYPTIVLSKDNSKLYFSNGNNGVISVSMKDGQNDWVCTERMSVASGLYVLDNDNVLVADPVSTNIFQITGDGHMLGAVLQKKDGIEAPIDVCVDKANSKLIVTSFKSDKIQVFKMN